MKAVGLTALMGLAVRINSVAERLLLSHAFNDTRSGDHCRSLA